MCKKLCKFWLSCICTGSGGATVAAAKVARSDGYGEWQQLTLGGTNTGGGNIYLISNPSVTLTGFNIGDVVESFVEIQVDPGMSASINTIALSTIFGGGNQIALNGGNAYPITIDGWSGVLRTPPYTLTATTASAMYLKVFLLSANSNAPVSGVIRFGRAGVRKVPSGL
jgi:hypothetical protein